MRNLTEEQEKAPAAEDCTTVKRLCLFGQLGSSVCKPFDAQSMSDCQFGPCKGHQWHDALAYGMATVALHSRQTCFMAVQIYNRTRFRTCAAVDVSLPTA